MNIPAFESRRSVAILLFVYFLPHINGRDSGVAPGMVQDVVTRLAKALGCEAQDLID